MSSEVGHVEFDLFFKECEILQLIPGINNAKIAAGHVVCAVNGMLKLKCLLQWLNSDWCHSHPWDFSPLLASGFPLPPEKSF